MAELKKRKRRGRSPGRRRLVPILPNLLTTVGLVLGLASVAASVSVLELRGLCRGFPCVGVRPVLVGGGLHRDGGGGRHAGRKGGPGAEFREPLRRVLRLSLRPRVVRTRSRGSSLRLGAFGLRKARVHGHAALRGVRGASPRPLQRAVRHEGKERVHGSSESHGRGSGVLPHTASLRVPRRPTPLAKSFYLFFVPLAGLVMVSEIPHRKFPELAGLGPFSTLVAGAIVITALVTNPGVVAVAVTYGYFLLELGLCAWKLALKAAAGKKEPEDLRSGGF